MQVTTSAGSRIVKRHSKDPVRIAAGKRAYKAGLGAGEDKQVRSSHLGYDCYVTGNVNNGGRTRVIQRRSRIPPHLPPDMIAIMPVEMWWPQRDHQAAHALVEAIITADLATLANWKSSWPEHEFGFERYLDLCERRKTGLAEKKAEGAPKRTDGTEERSGFTSLFPGSPVSVERHGGRDEDTFCVRTWIVRFDDGQAALRVDVKGVVTGPETIERVPCSRAYVDLIDGRFEIIEHYPGRLRALGLPVDLIYQVLGARAPQTASQRQQAQHRLHVYHREPRPPTRRQHALQVVKEAEQAQTILSTGDLNAEVVRDRVQKPDPMPIAGNGRYERQVVEDREQQAAEEEFERFPDAPGSRPSGR